MGKRKKKNSISNIKKDLNSESKSWTTGVENQTREREIVEADADEDSCESNCGSKLLEQTDTFHPVVARTETSADSNEQDSVHGTVEGKLQGEEGSCSTFPIHVSVLSDEDVEGNVRQDERVSLEIDGKIKEIHSGNVEDRNTDENNFISSLMESNGDKRGMDASEVPGTDAINHEDSNLRDIHAAPTGEASALPALLAAYDVEVTEQSILKMNDTTQISSARIPETLDIETARQDLLSNQNPHYSDEDLAEKNRNLHAVENETGAEELGRILEQTDLQESKAEDRTEVDIEMCDITDAADTVSSIPTKITEQSESQEAREGNENSEGSERKECETAAIGEIISESDITESMHEIDGHLISNEALRSKEDAVVPENMVVEKLVETEELKCPEIFEENSNRIDTSDTDAIAWHDDSIKESQTTANLSENETIIACGLEAMKDSEESNVAEAILSKNKFYEALSGFWKYTTFSKKRSENTVSCGQSKNLSTESAQASSIHSSKTSLMSAECLGVPSSESIIKSTKTSSDSTAKITDSSSDASVIASLMEYTATEATSCSHPNYQLINALISEDTNADIILGSLEMVKADPSCTSDEPIKHSRNSSEKMEDQKKNRKGKTESAHSTVFGHKVRQMPHSLLSPPRISAAEQNSNLIMTFRPFELLGRKKEKRIHIDLFNANELWALLS